MRAFKAFFFKELTESVRTYKLFIAVTVFLLLGAMSPLLAYFTPVILEAVASEFELHLPDPTALDAWMQFFGNIGQIGLLTLVIVFGGLTAGDIGKGTVINMLTKGLRRGTVIAAKVSAAVAVWTGCYLLSILASWAYTAYFWDAPALSGVFLAFFTMWLYGVLLICAVTFAGVLFTNLYGSLLFAGGMVVLMSLLDIVPAVRKFNPISLSGDNYALLTAQKTAPDALPSLFVCLFCIALLYGGSVTVFNKKRI